MGGTEHLGTSPRVIANLKAWRGTSAETGFKDSKVCYLPHPSSRGVSIDLLANGLRSNEVSGPHSLETEVKVHLDDAEPDPV